MISADPIVCQGDFGEELNSTFPVLRRDWNLSLHLFYAVGRVSIPDRVAFPVPRRDWNLALHLFYAVGRVSIPDQVVGRVSIPDRVAFPIPRREWNLALQTNYKQEVFRTNESPPINDETLTYFGRRSKVPHPKCLSRKKP